MADDFQRLLTMSGPEALSLNAQAALGAVRQPERRQFAHLVRLFLERFFNHETASPDGDGKTRLVQVACAVGLPGLMVAVYLWPIYHPMLGWRTAESRRTGAPPYWLQVNHHFFFVLYSFVAMGLATVFEWDLFFPDLLDMNVLGPLPIADTRVFAARVTAIAVLIAGFLFDANILAPLVLPSAIDPPNLPRFLAGHLLAVFGSGLFAAVFVLAVEGVLLAVLGERLFRRVSLALQGAAIAALLIALLLFPVLSGVVPVILQSGSASAFWFPPFWFLGVYQRLMEGPAALPIFARLAQIGCTALLATAVVAVMAYPIAYARKVKQLVEGAPTRAKRNRMHGPMHWLLHALVVRQPVRRAVFHFIGQTLLRVQRYRIYLVMYGGVGVSLVATAILRFTVAHGRAQIEISVDGIRAAVGMVAFWIIAGMRMAFVSSGNQQGSWIFRLIHGRPPRLAAAMELLGAAKKWVLLFSVLVTCTFCLVFCAIAPAQLRGWQPLASMLLAAVGVCVLLTDLFFMNVKIVAFTGQPTRHEPNLAFAVLKYLVAFTLVSSLTPALEIWIQSSVRHAAAAAAGIAAVHLVLRHRHRGIIRVHSDLPALEDGEEEFPMRLGLRY